MAKREIATVYQPCILCQSTLEVWHILRDEEAGTEHIDREPVAHDCPAMGDLLRERARYPHREAYEY